MKIYLGDWLTNAAILGYLRIQKARGIKKYENISKGYIEIMAEDLTSFEEAYFSYALKRGLGYFLQFKSLKKLQKYIEEKKYSELLIEVKSLVSSVSQKIKIDYNNFDKTVNYTAKEIDKLFNLSKNLIEEKISADIQLKQKASKIIENIKKEIEEIKEELTNEKYNYITTQLKRFFFNKAIVGNYSLSENNRKEAFYKEYILPAQDILSRNSTVGITCKFCGQNKVNISKFDNVNNFFGEGIFSPIGVTLGFQNFFYNLQSDFVMCDVCELLLLCTWAGFTEIPWRFRDKINDTDHIFVNVPNLELLFEENQRINNIYEISGLELEGTIYDEIIYDLFVKEKEKKSDWVLQNILFVEIKPVSRKDQDKPNFKYFHIGKDIAKIFKDETAIQAIKGIRGRIYTRFNKENIRDSVFVYAKRDTIRRLLSRDSLYPLCFTAIKDQIENPNKNNVENTFNLSVLNGIRNNIWKNQKGENNMESRMVFGILKGFRENGEVLGKGMDYDKRKRLSYRLLSLIRTYKITDFYEALMKLYISQSKEIPETLVNMLNKEDAIEPEAKAYAFMSGFLGHIVEQTLQ